MLIGIGFIPTRALLIALTATIMAAGQTRAQDETALYDRASLLIEAGQFERARLNLETLVNAYPKTTLRIEVRAAIRKSWVKQGISGTVSPIPF